MTRSLPIALALLSLAAISQPSHAAEGVREVNQACAEGDGCFDGDTPGFPVTITTPGSYRLTSDLFVSSASVLTDGIRVLASYVTLDLAGFEIRGAATCSGTPPVCLPATANGSGVYALWTTEGVEVRGGSVRGFGYGVKLEGRNGVVTAIQARANRIYGVIANPGARVTRIHTAANQQSGISQYVGGGSFFADCVSADNGGSGLVVGESLVADSALQRNSEVGGTGAALFLGVTAGENGLEGLRGYGPMLVVGSGAVANARDGITSGPATPPIAVNRSVARANGLLGLSFLGDGAYRESVMTDNATGPVAGGADRAGNHCAGPATVNPTCP
jgi:hypothetical protein